MPELDFREIVTQCRRWKEITDYELATHTLTRYGPVDEVAVYLHTPNDAINFSNWARTQDDLNFFNSDAQTMYEVRGYEVTRRKQYAYHVQFGFYQMGDEGWRIATQVPQTVAPVEPSKHPLFLRDPFGDPDAFLENGAVFHCSFKCDLEEVHHLIMDEGGNRLLRMASGHGESAYYGATFGTTPYLHPRQPYGWRPAS